MSSFFSSFGNTYAEGLLQKKQQDHENDLAQQKQYLDMLNAAANSPAAQQWSPDQWKTYTDAVINAGDVKSQKDPKKSGLGGVFQKLGGGAKGGSNLQEKLQQIFGAGGGAMTQTAGAGAPSGAPGPANPATAVSGQFSPPFSPEVAGAPEGARINPGQPAPLTPATGTSPSGPPVGAMPESFAPRSGPPGLKTVRGASGPPSAPAALTIGGSAADYGQKPDLILRDPNTGHHVGHYVGKNGKVYTVDYGPGQTEQEFDIQKRSEAQVKKAQAIRQGDLDTAISLGIQEGAYPDYETGYKVEAQKYREYLHGKWNAPLEKEREAHAAEVDRAGRLAAREREITQKYNDYLLRANGQQRASAEFQFQQTATAVKGIDEKIAQSASRRSELERKRDGEFSNPPNPRLNPNDTQEAKDARIANYNKAIDEENTVTKTLFSTRDALLGTDFWATAPATPGYQRPPSRVPRTGSSAPPSRRPAASSGGTDPNNPAGLRRPGQ